MNDVKYTLKSMFLLYRTFNHLNQTNATNTKDKGLGLRNHQEKIKTILTNTTY